MKDNAERRRCAPVSACQVSRIAGKVKPKATSVSERECAVDTHSVRVGVEKMVWLREVPEEATYAEQTEAPRKEDATDGRRS